MPADIGIVLTGTIIPNTTFVTHGNSETRKREYIAAIKFYSQFAPVYFLENSAYDLFSDEEFLKLENCFLRKFPLSKHYHRGKGYQEFEMIAQWLATEAVAPKRFIKITGRYQITNFKDIFAECLGQKDGALLIDRQKWTSFAVTRMFYADTAYYKANLSDVYKGCNDESGDWVERVLYKRLVERKLDSSFFWHEPMVVGITGTSGFHFTPSRSKWFVKSILRRINYFLNKKCILYR